jgi:AraC-like DNA-binding protein
VGDTIVGYLQTGQVFLHAPSRKYFDRFARTLPNRRAGAGAHDVRAAYFKTRVVAPRQYASTIRLLAIFADHLATVSHQLLLRTAAVEPAAATRGRQFIAGHHAEDISLADAARAAHLSTAYFCKLFKVATGVGFAEYLARTRIETANRMLLDPRLHISEAAFAAGFQSLSQFNRVFRRVMGEAPGQYRERMHRQGGRAARPGALGHAA